MACFSLNDQHIITSMEPKHLFCYIIKFSVTDMIITKRGILYSADWKFEEGYLLAPAISMIIFTSIACFILAQIPPKFTCFLQ